MKSMIVFVSCMLAAASAGYSAYGPSSYAYQGNSGYNSPVNHGGLPVPVQDTYEVAAAKAAHFQAHAAATAQARASPLDHGHSYTSAVAHGYAHAAPVAHGGYYGAPSAAGAPLPVQDTYEVAAAKAAHAQAHAAARGQAIAGPVAHGYGYAHAAPVAHGGYYGAPSTAGAPLPVQDTYEVAAAKAAHFQAHAAARGQAIAGPVAHGYGYAHAAPVAHGGYYGAPSAAGAPLPVQDTYEVAAAKAAHAQAHAAAKNGHLNQY